MLDPFVAVFRRRQIAGAVIIESRPHPVQFQLVVLGLVAGFNIGLDAFHGAFQQFGGSQFVASIVQHVGQDALAI